jgi:hydrogenase expression/formation protein HypE
MNRLLEEVFFQAFDHPALKARHDSASLTLPSTKIAFTTDSFVIKPRTFPGGDLGKLAVCGVVNDLAMAGARPLYLSASFILEEGLPMEALWQTAKSLAEMAADAGVAVVTGDTKVVEKGKGDGIFVTLAAVGERIFDEAIEPASIRAGDVIVISGDLGRHAMAVMGVREGLEFDPPLLSDCGLIFPSVAAMHERGLRPHCLRDLTRGGLAAALTELAQASGLSAEIDEAAIPVDAQVENAASLFGLDPMHLACEGRFVAVVEEDDVESTLEALRSEAISHAPNVIGIFSQGRGVPLVLKTRLGTERVVDLPAGQALPRIC